jgi:heme-degrading monooxygenase HmoA
MIQVVWEFIVKESAVRKFMRAYGPGGAWDRLFRGHPGFLGTALLRDAENPRRFLTIDSWETGAQRSHMMSHTREEYVNLDELLDDLTEDQDEIGTFSIVGRAPVYPVPAAAGKRGDRRGAERRSRRTRR